MDPREIARERARRALAGEALSPEGEGRPRATAVPVPPGLSKDRALVYEGRLLLKAAGAARVLRRACC